MRWFALIVLGWQASTLTLPKAGAEESAPTTPSVTAPIARTPSEATEPKRAETWSDARIAELVKGLSDDLFSVREKAAETLAQIPGNFLSQLLAISTEHEDPETRQRLVRVARDVFMQRVVEALPEWKKPRGFMGIQWAINEEPPGVTVNGIIPNTGAANAGLQDGDVIVKIGKFVCAAGLTSDEAMAQFRGMLPGDEMKLEVNRNGETVNLSVTIGEVPEEYRDETNSSGQTDERRENLWVRFQEGNIKLPTPTVAAKPVETPDAKQHPPVPADQPTR